MKTAKIESFDSLQYSDEFELPDGWNLLTVGEISSAIQYGYTESAIQKKDGPRFLRITDIQDGRVNWDIVPSCEISKDDYQKFELKTGDIVFARTGATTGKSFLIQSCPNAVFASYLIRIRPNEKVVPKFLHLFFQTPAYWQMISENVAGIAQPNCNASKLKNLPIPLPPLDEQKRIVARVEALLTHVNAARDRLSRVPLIIKRFRQGVLAAACSGRLTEGWREGNISQISSEDFLKQALDFKRRYYTKKSNKKYKEPVTLSDDLPFSLPDEWTWATLDQISQFVTDGDHYPPKRLSTGIPHLTSKHVKKWKLSYEDCTFISHDDYEIVKVRYEPQEGDVILTCVGTIGETAIVPKNFIFSADRNLAAIRLFSEFFLPQMLQFIFNSSPWENHIKTVSGSTAQPHIYLKDLRAMAVPLPPLAEQHEIVRRVRLLFERADAFDQEVAAASQRCELLTQAVLGKAFAGKI